MQLMSPNRRSCRWVSAGRSPDSGSGHRSAGGRAPGHPAARRAGRHRVGPRARAGRAAGGDRRCAAGPPRRARRASAVAGPVDQWTAGRLHGGGRHIHRLRSTGSASRGPTSRFAASTASSTAKLSPFPPTGEMTCAASPISSRPGSLHRSTDVIRTGSRVSWLTSVSPSSRSPSQGSRRRNAQPPPARSPRRAAPGTFPPGSGSRAASCRPGRGPRARHRARR